jgi:hypothetical protein
VLWIGGPPGGGKSSVATRIARRHGLRWYGADTRTWRHRDRALRAGSEAARRWEAMTPEQLWVRSTLPAWALSSGVADRSRAVWLLPTRRFQRATLADRDVLVPLRALSAGPVLALGHR